MPKKQAPAIDIRVILVCIAAFAGYHYKDQIKIPTNLFPSSSKVEVTTAPSLNEIFKTDASTKSDAERIAGILDGLATEGQAQFAAQKIKTTLDLYNLLATGQRIAFGGTSVATKYPAFKTTYDTWVSATIPTESQPLTQDLVNNFVTKTRELAKSARNASL